MTIPILLAAEDRLSEAVLRRLLAGFAPKYAVGACYGLKGNAYLRRKIAGFNAAAQGTPWLILTDLDSCDCAPALVADWLPHGANSNLLLRVAVREVEAWLLADQRGFARFAGIESTRVPLAVEELLAPKSTLIELACNAKPEVRDDLVPRHGSTSRIGPNYNGRLAGFVAKQWSVTRAQRHAPSLRSAVAALNAFRPPWPQG